MADYDWFTPTDAQLREQAEHAARLQSRGFEEKGYHKETLVCTLCGCVIYGNLDDKYAVAHRLRCYEPEKTNGKHRSD